MSHERLAKECLSLAKKYRDEKELNKKYREALKFYADESIYPKGKITLHNDMQLRKILEDHGEIARGALNEN